MKSQYFLCEAFLNGKIKQGDILNWEWSMLAFRFWQFSVGFWQCFVNIVPWPVGEPGRFRRVTSSGYTEERWDPDVQFPAGTQCHSSYFGCYLLFILTASYRLLCVCVWTSSGSNFEKKVCMGMALRTRTCILGVSCIIVLLALIYLLRIWVNNQIWIPGMSSSVFCFLWAFIYFIFCFVL